MDGNLCLNLKLPKLYKLESFYQVSKKEWGEKCSSFETLLFVEKLLKHAGGMHLLQDITPGMLKTPTKQP